MKVDHRVAPHAVPKMTAPSVAEIDGVEYDAESVLCTILAGAPGLQRRVHRACLISPESTTGERETTMSENKITTTPMTTADASKIQSHAAKTGTNQDFARRAQGAAARNAGQGGARGSRGGSGGRRR